MPHRLPDDIKNASTRRATLVMPAPAKLNLALSVGPPRPGDGYHPIASWMTPISLCDEVSLTRLEEDRLSRYAIVWSEDAPRPSPIDWAITRDLAVRAHRLLEEREGRPLPVQIKVTKRVPVGGGLGGGSSDAAAALRGVVQLFNIAITRPELLGIALKLGSDVPFFLHQGAMVVEGVGEVLTPAPSVTGAAVLLFPPFGCPTREVYKAYDAAPVALDAERVKSLARCAGGRIDSSTLFNDLADAAERVALGLGELRRRAAELAGRPVHVTGSGSTMFVLCDDLEQAQACRAKLTGTLKDVAPVCVELGFRGESGA